jgi:NTE family protein
MGVALQRPLALVLSGGGAQGAAQAGAAVELRRCGVLPDLVIGTSVGAWNGAWLARDSDPWHAERLVNLWLDPELTRLFRGVVPGFLWGLARRRIAALSDARLRRLLARQVGSIRFADLAVPLAVGVIDLLTGELIYLDTGLVCDAVHAASAIPAVLPPVRLGSRLLVDAGFVDNFGVAEAIRRGARSMIVLDASVGVLEGAPRRIPTVLERANLVTRIHQRHHACALASAHGIALEIIELAGRGTVLDFGDAAAGIDYGRERARAWLATAGVSAIVEPLPAGPHAP